MEHKIQTEIKVHKLESVKPLDVKSAPSRIELKVEMDRVRKSIESHRKETR